MHQFDWAQTTAGNIANVPIWQTRVHRCAVAACASVRDTEGVLQAFLCVCNCLGNCGAGTYSESVCVGHKSANVDHRCARHFVRCGSSSQRYMQLFPISRIAHILTKRFPLFFGCCCCCYYCWISTVSAFTALQTVTLLTLQCARRFYETQYVQIFSGHSKINITHYIVGYFHYFGAFLAIVSRAPGFVRDTDDLAHIEIDTIFPRNLSMTLIFLAACYQQCRANLMLANLRKNRKGMQTHGPSKMYAWPLNARYFGFFFSPLRRRCCDRKAFDAGGWLLRFCVVTAYVLRNSHVHGTHRRAVQQFVVVVGVPVGGQQPIRERMAHTQMVSGHIQRLPERPTRYCTRTTISFHCVRYLLTATNNVQCAVQLKCVRKCPQTGWQMRLLVFILFLFFFSFFVLMENLSDSATRDTHFIKVAQFFTNWAINMCTISSIQAAAAKTPSNSTQIYFECHTVVVQML